MKVITFPRNLFTQTKIEDKMSSKKTFDPHSEQW